MEAGEEDESENEQAALRKQIAELQQQRILELQRRQVLKQVLEPEAYERLANIRTANPELYAQLAQLLLYLYQNGQIPGRLTEKQLTNLISKILSKQRRETTITRLKK